LKQHFAQGVYLDDLYQWEPSTLAWREIFQQNRIPRRASAGVASLAGLIFVFGGVNNSSRLNDFHTWNITTGRWTEMDKNGSDFPTRREGHGLVSIESLQKLFLFGGVVEVSGKDRLSSDLYEYDLRTSKWKNLSQSFDKISARSHFGITSTSDRVYVFGGIVEDHSCILFEYNPITSISKCLKEAAGYPRRTHIMPGLASIQGRLYIFGGLTSDGKVVLILFELFDFCF
jgi:N-acetylneuraminic acid mutarotase